MRLTNTILCLSSLSLLASAAPALTPRQDEPDYGFWNVTITEESGRPGWTYRDLTAWYYRGELQSTSTCRYSFVPQGTSPPSETNKCDNADFTYSWGAPWYTLNITQTVEIDGERVTIYGSGLATRKCGLGAGSACRSTVHAEAGVMPL